MFPLNCIEITFGRPKISQQTALAIGGIYGTKMTSWYDGIPPCTMPSCEKRSRCHLRSYVKTSAIDTTLVNTTSECSDQPFTSLPDKSIHKMTPIDIIKVWVHAAGKYLYIKVFPNQYTWWPLYHHSLSPCYNKKIQFVLLSLNLQSRRTSFEVTYALYRALYIHLNLHNYRPESLDPILSGWVTYAHWTLSLLHPKRPHNTFILFFFTSLTCGPLRSKEPQKTTNI